jgi:predicted phage tail protein
MQNFRRFAATILRGSLFGLTIALTACNLNGTGSANSVDTGASAAVTDSSALSSTSPIPSVNVAPTTSGTPATTAANRSAQLSWSMPLTNTDGSALTDLAGFHVYYGTDPSNLTLVDVPNAASVAYTAANLTAGTYYFTVTAYNSSGVESAQPTVASAVIS